MFGDGEDKILKKISGEVRYLEILKKKNIYIVQSKRQNMTLKGVCTFYAFVQLSIDIAKKNKCFQLE